MKLCERNKKPIHYKNLIGSSDIVDEQGFFTGETELEYSDFKGARVSMTPNKGSASAEMFGSDLNYSRTIRTDDMDCDLEENSIVWIDNTIDKPHDYVVVAKAEGLTNIAYAVKKVDVSEV